MIRSLAAIAFVAVLVIGDARAAGTKHSDPANLVEFDLPSGWVERDKESGIRFGRGVAGDRTVLKVVATRRKPETDAQRRRETGLQAIKMQEHRLLVDRIQEIDGWTAWESVVDAARGGRGPTKHSFHLFSKNLEVEVTLMAETAEYPKYKDDLLALVKTVRER